MVRTSLTMCNDIIPHGHHTLTDTITCVVTLLFDQTSPQIRNKPKGSILVITKGARTVMIGAEEEEEVAGALHSFVSLLLVVVVVDVDVDIAGDETAETAAVEDGEVADGKA
jgi:hypothetical protein